MHPPAAAVLVLVPAVLIVHSAMREVVVVVVEVVLGEALFPSPLVVHMEKRRPTQMVTVVVDILKETDTTTHHIMRLNRTRLEDITMSMVAGMHLHPHLPRLTKVTTTRIPALMKVSIWSCVFHLEHERREVLCHCPSRVE